MVSSVSSATSAISQLFSRLDTKSKGYLEKSDFTSAFSQIGGVNSSSSESSGIDKVFAALDNNNDGKVTESEFSTTLNKLKSELDSQFTSMRLQGFGGTQGAGGMAGMPPPPPPADDAGFSKDELQSQLEQIGSSDSQRSSFISNVVNNFSAADSNGDSKVSFAEARAYNSPGDSAGSSSATGSAAGSSASNDDARIMMKIMQLLHAYGDTGQNVQNSAVSSLLSVSA